ncbi:hypothetical protein V5799_004538 [Amblyomma americanum]|uniref:Uncharacterized protein n=1 Tax=Amblyomma americanum TaxID=6943 RepID=A0AAQ4D5U1_AMBAM
MEFPKDHVIKPCVHRGHAQQPGKRSPPKERSAGLHVHERDQSKPSSSEAEDSEDISGDSFPFTFCLLVVTLALLIATVILYLDYGPKLAQTSTPVLPKFRDFEIPDSLRNRTSDEEQTLYHHAPYAMAHNLARAHPQEIPLKSVMNFLCVRYGFKLNSSLADVKAFTGYFKLNLWQLREEPTEDVLARMLQLSLEYGLHPVVSFVRHFRYARDPSEPFELQE